MVNPYQEDRRAHPRMTVRVPLGKDNQGDKLTCYLKDISRAGAAAVVNKPMEEMSLVLVEAVLGGDDLPLIEIAEEAVVVRCDDLGGGQHEIGLFFHRMRADLRDAIDYYIDQALTLTI